MKRVSVILLLVVLLAACSQQGNPGDTELSAQAGSWQKVGGALDYTAEKDAINPRLLLDRSGNLVVAWVENNNGWKLYLERWTSTGWQTFGVGFPLATSTFTATFDSTNSLVIGTYANTTNFQTAVFRRDVQSKIWKQLGASFTGAVSVSSDKNGAIYSIRYDPSTGKNFIRRWDGSSWQTVYTFQKVVSYAGEQLPVRLYAFGFKSNGTPIGFWVYPDQSQETQVSAWNGSSWSDIAVLYDYGFFDKKDQPLAVKIFGGGEGAVIRRNGQDLGNPFDKTTTLAITVDAVNRPVIAYGIKGTGTANNDLIAKRWTGSTWESLGGVIDRVSTRTVQNPNLLVDNSGTIYAVWQECFTFNSVSQTCTNHNIYVSKYVP